MQKGTLKRWSARVAAATAIAATAALIPAASAHAVTPNTFRLCNYGSGYDTVVEFPNQGGYAFRVLAGKCQTVRIGRGTSNEPLKLHAVQGIWKGPRSYVFAGFGYDDKRGIDITTRGTYGAVNWGWQ
ncbi:hypothetical protein [Streptomyces sp. NBC_01294]|uniref:hypothetical protein n=1 Tax=Streptomyces sp. NBC_01294 TaxID=2903815 RepID=UPI002DD86B85|nr:hypothetical protein [Streptomyces sp. NBC_01294]WRZ60795.1 hypothetical protein OG534_32460 [Streptomyces sp. NBC_01294]